MVYKTKEERYPIINIALFLYLCFLDIYFLDLVFLLGMIENIEKIKKEIQQQIEKKI